MSGGARADAAGPTTRRTPARSRGASPEPARSWTWWREASGSVADLGVLVPIAVALIVGNGLSTTAALVPAGLAYLLVAVVYRLPVAVQPLKAFGAVAIATGSGPEVIAAGALLMGAVFTVLALTGWLDRVARVFPRAVIRGVQLAVGLTFLRIAVGLVADPPGAFVGQLPLVPAGVVTVVLVVVLVWRRGLVLVAVVGALVAAAALGGWDGWGPSVVELPSLDGAAFATAAVLLVVPQLPLTFTNSCLAPPDAARVYFGDRAAAVTPSRLALTLGATNLVVGAVGGMPVCHGAGGMSAHHAAGGRTWRTPVIVGGALVVLAVAAGASLSGVLTAFPLPVLAALLVVAGLAHVRLLRDLSSRQDWALALVVGLLGMLNLAVAVLVGLLGAWAVRRWWR